jgi:hypothetical protein
VSRSVFAINISSLPTFQAGSSERSSALMGTTVPFAWPRRAVTPQSPKGRAGRREGLTANARAKPQWCRGYYTAN